MLYREQLLESARLRAEDFICWREAEPVKVVARDLVVGGKLYTVCEGTSRRNHLVVVSEYANPLNVVMAARRPLAEGEKWNSFKNIFGAKEDAELLKKADVPKSQQQKDEKVYRVIEGWANNPHRNVKDVIAALLPNFNRLYLMFISDTELYGVTQEQFKRALEAFMEKDEGLQHKIRNRRYGVTKEHGDTDFDEKKPGTWIKALKAALFGLRAFEDDNGTPVWGKGDRDHHEFVKLASKILALLKKNPEAARGFDPLVTEALKAVDRHSQNSGHAAPAEVPREEAPENREAPEAKESPAPEAEKPEQPAAPENPVETPKEEAPEAAVEEPAPEKEAPPAEKPKKSKADVSASEMLKLMRKRGQLPKSAGTENTISEWEQSQDDVRRGLVALIKGGNRAAKGIYLWGAPGTGKTEDVRGMLNTLAEEYDFEYFVADAETFPSKKKCVEFLYKHRDKDIVVIDEAEKALKREDVVDLWKIILNLSADRKISYGEDFPPFVIHSKFVFIANSRDIDDAIRSRLTVMKYEFTFDDMVAKIKRTLKPSDDIKLKPKEIEEVINYVVSLCRNTPDRFNYRSVMLGIQNRQMFPEEWQSATKRDLDRKQEKRKRSNG